MVPIGNIFVPFNMQSGSRNKKSDKHQKKENNVKEEEKVTISSYELDLQAKKARYSFERQEVMPEVRQFISELLLQNSNLEEHLVQLFEIFELVGYQLKCNDFITMYSSVGKTDTINYVIFVALDRFLENAGKNMPLFSIDAKTDAVSGEVLSVRIECAKVIGEKLYSFELTDGLILDINHANEDVANVFYRDTITGEVIDSYEVSKTKGYIR